VAQSLDNLAVLYQDQGQHAEAEPLHKRALAIRLQSGQVHRGRAALQASPSDRRNSFGTRTPLCSHEPQQPGAAL
jgi:hypothetical protein